MADESTQCVVCGGNLIEHSHSETMFVGTINQDLVKVIDFYHCDECGIRYEKLPKANACIG